MYLRSNLQGLHLFKTDSIVSVLDRIIMIALCVECFYIGWTQCRYMNYGLRANHWLCLNSLYTFWIVLRELIRSNSPGMAIQLHDA